jgi:signal transduction histidine kinase
MDKQNDIFLIGLNRTFLRKLLWLVAGLNVILGAQSMWAYHFDPSHFLDNLAIVCIALVGLFILPRKGFQVALGWLLWATWCALGVVMAMRNGLRDPTALTFPLFIVLAGWLLGRRQAIFMVCISAILACLLAIADNYGLLGIASPSSYMMLTTVFIAVLVIGAVVSLAISASVLNQHARVIELNRTLETRVLERTAHLELVNRELQGTLQTLQSAQRELVESEKMASLGSMVAGIAHELNTPIGNAVTAASTLSHEVEMFVAKSQEAAIRRSTISEFGIVALGLSELITRSTHRAAELISSFKRVAVDRTSEHRRIFDLRLAVDELVLTLRPTFKKTPWSISVQGSVGLKVDSYPGPLEQVLSNLILNAFMHAFDGRENGSVSIALERVQSPPSSSQIESQLSWICIHVQDDGIGMSQEVMQHIFEPFFTTKLGRGGSGLGLSISHNIVKSLLGGTLTVASTPAHGSTFTLTIPDIAPEPIPSSTSLEENSPIHMEETQSRKSMA